MATQTHLESLLQNTRILLKQNVAGDTKYTDAATREAAADRAIAFIKDNVFPEFGARLKNDLKPGDLLALAVGVFDAQKNTFWEFGDWRKDIDSLLSGLVQSGPPPIPRRQAKAGENPPIIAVPPVIAPEPKKAGGNKLKYGAAGVAALAAGSLIMSGGGQYDPQTREAKSKWTFTRVVSTALLTYAAVRIGVGAAQGQTWGQMVKNPLTFRGLSPSR